MTQHDLATATGMPQPSIARIERGTVTPRSATLMEILGATGHRLSVEPIGPAVDQEAIRRQLAMAIPRRTQLAFGSARILKRLRRFGVPFVLIGELAEVVHGSPAKPAKADRVIEVCVASTNVARERLALALEDEGAVADLGRLRTVTETASGDTYDVLARNAVALPVEAGILVRVAALDDRIRIRRAQCRPEDDQAAAGLHAIVAIGAKAPTRRRTLG